MNGAFVVLMVFAGILLPAPVRAMHISEGILPVKHVVFWTILCGIVVFYSIKVINRETREKPYVKPFLGMIGAGVFLISAMPIPVPFAGTVSHPAGTGIAAILVGPAATIVITSVTLLFHALFLAHGGLSTLGANVFTMGVLGGCSGYFMYQGTRRMGLGQGVSAFLAGLAGDWATYLGTSFVLAAALRGPEHSFTALFLTVVIAFVPTQVPLGLLEGIIAVTAVKFLLDRRPAMVENLTRIVPVLLVAVGLFLFPVPPSSANDTESAWPGVDETVVEKTAEKHGQVPAEPLIPLEGDLLLFAFLCGGAVGGGLLGYYYHRFFVCPDTALDFDEN